MDKKAENNLINVLIGILLIMPFFTILLTIFNLYNLNDGNPLIYIILMIALTLPTIIGVILSYVFFKDKISKRVCITILIITLFIAYFFYDNTFVEHQGWSGLGSAILLPINAAINKVLSCILYLKIGGWKKVLLLFIIHVLIAIILFETLRFGTIYYLY